MNAGEFASILQSLVETTGMLVAPHLSGLVESLNFESLAKVLTSDFSVNLEAGAVATVCERAIDKFRKERSSEINEHITSALVLGLSKAVKNNPHLSIYGSRLSKDLARISKDRKGKLVSFFKSSQENYSTSSWEGGVAPALAGVKELQEFIWSDVRRELSFLITSYDGNSNAMLQIDAAKADLMSELKRSMASVLLNYDDARIKLQHYSQIESAHQMQHIVKLLEDLAELKLSPDSKAMQSVIDITVSVDDIRLELQEIRKQLSDIQENSSNAAHYSKDSARFSEISAHGVAEILRIVQGLSQRDATGKSRVSNNFAEASISADPFFCGREDDIAEIISLFEDHQIVSLFGQGGIGKSAVAKHIALIAVDHFDSVWFLRGSSIEADIQTILELRDQSLKSDESFAAFTRLIASERTLIILDDPSSIESQLVLGREVKLLVTTRDIAWRGESYEVLPLDSFSQIQLVLRMNPRLSDSSSDVTSLVARVDGLTLAVRIMSEILRERPTLSAMQLAELIDQESEIIRSPEISKHIADGYPISIHACLTVAIPEIRTLAEHQQVKDLWASRDPGKKLINDLNAKNPFRTIPAIWNLFVNQEKLQEAHQREAPKLEKPMAAAMNVLCTLAICDGTGISVRLLKADNPESLERAFLDRLVRYSVVNYLSDVRVHQLIQEALRVSIPSEMLSSTTYKLCEEMTIDTVSVSASDLFGKLPHLMSMARHLRLGLFPMPSYCSISKRFSDASYALQSLRNSALVKVVGESELSGWADEYTYSTLAAYYRSKSDWALAVNAIDKAIKSRGTDKSSFSNLDDLRKELSDTLLVANIVDKPDALAIEPLLHYVKSALEAPIKSYEYHWTGPLLAAHLAQAGRPWLSAWVGALVLRDGIRRLGVEEARSRHYTLARQHAVSLMLINRPKLARRWLNWSIRHWRERGQDIFSATDMTLLARSYLETEEFLYAERLLRQAISYGFGDDTVLSLQAKILRAYMQTRANGMPVEELRNCLEQWFKQTRRTDAWTLCIVRIAEGEGISVKDLCEAWGLFGVYEETVNNEGLWNEPFPPIKMG